MWKCSNKLKWLYRNPSLPVSSRKWCAKNESDMGLSGANKMMTWHGLLEAKQLKSPQSRPSQKELSVAKVAVKLHWKCFPILSSNTNLKCQKPGCKPAILRMHRIYVRSYKVPFTHGMGPHTIRKNSGECLEFPRPDWVPNLNLARWIQFHVQVFCELLAALNV